MKVFVLIADIVESRSIPNRESYQRKPREFLDAVSARAGRNLLFPYTITVGDEFQALYRNTRGVFGGVMQIVDFSFPHRIRFALAYGAVTTEPNRNAALGMDGPVFSSARSLLTGLKKQNSTVIRLDLPHDDSTELYNVCLSLFANDLEKWNQTAVSALARLRRGLAPREIACETGVHFTTAYRHAREKHLEDYRDLFTLLSRQIDSKISDEIQRL